MTKNTPSNIIFTYWTSIYFSEKISLESYLRRVIDLESQRERGWSGFTVPVSPKRNGSANRKSKFTEEIRSGEGTARDPPGVAHVSSNIGPSIGLVESPVGRRAHRFWRFKSCIRDPVARSTPDVWSSTPQDIKTWRSWCIYNCQPDWIRRGRNKSAIYSTGREKNVTRPKFSLVPEGISGAGLRNRQRFGGKDCRP